MIKTENPYNILILNQKNHFKRNIGLMTVAFISSMLILGAVTPPMVTISFTTAWTSESIYYIYITVQNPSTYAYSNYYLTTTNMSSGITIPAGYTLTSIIENSNQSASRFTSSFKPETDSFTTWNITSPASATITQTGLVTAYAYNSADVLLGVGYNAGATYYMTIGQWSGVLTLTTGTWTITITTFTQ